MSKATLCCQLFYPEMVSTGQTLTELAEVLSDMGVQLDVLCGPATVLKQTQRIPNTLSYHGIDIRRVWGTTFSKLSLVGRVINQVTYTLSMFWALLWDKKRTPLVVLTNPPFLGIVCALISRLYARPMIYVIFDVYPETAIACGLIDKNSLIAKMWRTLNQFCFHTSRSIVVLGRCMKTVIEAQLCKNDLPKLHHIHMWTDDNLLRKAPHIPNIFRKKWGLEDTFVLLYSGNMGRFHDMETFIKSAEILADVSFVFVGEGQKKQWCEHYAATKNLKNCQFHSYVKRDELPDLMGMADIGLVSLLPAQVGLSVPSKTFGLMAAGVPIVAVMPETSEIALILTENHCGSVIEPGNINGFIKAINSLRDDPEKRHLWGKAGKELINKKYSLAAAAEAYRLLFL